MKLFNNNFISVLLILFVLVLAVNSVSATDNNITDINNVNSNLSNVLKSSSSLNDGDAISYDLMDNKDVISQKFSSNSNTNDKSNMSDVVDSIESVAEPTSLDSPILRSVVPSGITFDGVFHVGTGQQYSNIQDALDQCRRGGYNYQIIIHEGTYTGYGNKNLVIEPTTWWNTNFGYLDIRTANDGDVVILNAERSPSILTINSRNVHITGLTFMNAYNYGSGGTSGAGVAINIRKGTVSIDNCSFINNEARNLWGGAVHIDSSRTNPISNIDITNSLFVNNSAEVGGAFRSERYSSNINIINTTFINNTATEHGGVACLFSTDVTFANCNFINNSAPSSGGIHFHVGGSHIDNCTFINNSAYGTGSSEEGYGGAIALVYSTSDGVIISNSSFSNNFASKYGGAIDVNGSGSNAKILNCNFENNTAGYGGAIRVQGSNTVIDNNSLINNKAINTDGGGIHVEGSNTQISNTIFRNNSAAANGGALAIVAGDNTFVSNSVIANNTAVNGAGAYIQGRRVTISDSIVANNTADQNGAGVYIDGSYATIKDSTIYNNNATVNGGGAYINGRDATISNVNFVLNNAIPDEEALDDGLGGAIFIAGSNSYIEDSNFTYNTARNGSAIYIDPTSSIANNYIYNCNFTENQAWSYWLPIFYNDVTKTIESNLTGGNNILNAIYNNGSNLHIFIDGVNPVLGWENSQNGTIMYQDNREFNQTIVTLVWDRHGNLVFNETAVTDLAGNVCYDIPQDTHLWFIVSMTHLEDTYYKEITNITGININPGLTITDVTMYEGNATPQTIYIVLADDDANPIPNEGPIMIYVMVNGNKILLGSGNTSKNAVLIFNESAVFKTLNPGNYTIIAECTYAYYNETTQSISNKTVSTEGILEVLPYIWSLNKTISHVNGIPYIEGMVIQINDNVTFNITVFNEVNTTLYGLKLIDLNTEGLSYVSTLPSNWNYEGNNVWTLDNLVNYGNSSLFVTFKVLKTGNLTNIVNCSFLDGFKNKSANITFAVNLTADLGVSKVVNVSNPNYGDFIKYTVVVSNAGPDDATGVVVNETLPVGLVYVSDDASVGSYDHVAGLWTVGSLAKGDSATLIVVVRVGGTGNIQNFVNVSGAEYDNNTGNNKANVTVAVNQLKTYIIVSNNTVYPGDDVTVIVTVTTQNGSLFNGNVNVALNDAANTTKVVTIVDGTGSFKVTVDKNLVNGYVIGINASYDGNDTYIGSKGFGWIKVLPVKFHVEKTIVKGNEFFIGDEIIFNITVYNDCNGTLYNLVVSDVLPNGVVLINSGFGLWTYDGGSSWSYGDLSAGASATLIIKSSAVKAGSFTNDAKATVNDVLDNSSLVDFSISKLNTSISVSNVTGHPGDVVVITIKVSTGDNVPFNGDVDVILPDGKKIIVHVTNGIAKFKWTIPKNAKNNTIFSIFVSFAGSSKYFGSNNTGFIKVIDNKQNKTNHTDNNDFTDKCNKGIIKNTGNPLLVLLISIVILVISLKRRKDY